MMNEFINIRLQILFTALYCRRKAEITSEAFTQNSRYFFISENSWLIKSQSVW